MFGQPQTRNFSLVNGGPLYRLLVRLRLVMPGAPVGPRVVAFFLLLSWVPPLFLAAFEGVFAGPAVRIPLLLDFAFHLRFLLAVPLLVMAERIIGSRISDAVSHFRTSGLIAESDQPRLEAAIEEAAHRRDSWTGEIFLLVVVAMVGIAGGGEILHASSWHEPRPGDSTLAGWYYAGLSLPLFRLLLLRWFWRLLIWALLLGRIARLPPRLRPGHPDMAGGIGFLGFIQAKFALVVLPLSIVTAANAGEKIVYDAVPLTIVQPSLLAFAGLMVGIFIAPLFVFTPLMVVAKKTGVLRYGRLAIRYARLFEDKWMRERPEEELLGTSDIQSLADLGNSFDYVRKMKPFPFDARTLAALAGAAVAPVLPLALTALPAREILRMVLKLLV